MEKGGKEIGMDKLKPQDKTGFLEIGVVGEHGQERNLP